MKERNNCNNMGKTSDYIYQMLLYWTLACVRAWGSGGYLKKEKHLKTLLHLNKEEKQAGLTDEKGLGEQ